jgi:superfamily II DNA or RNA helicase
MASTYAAGLTVGSLVRVREREWVVLFLDDQDVLSLRPLSGSDSETCGIHLALEGDSIEPASFPMPDPQAAGDFVAGTLLRDAARLSLRNGAGPFRSLGQLSVRPRPYQFVPLIMALRLDVVRMLIADDVGIGKTIEGALIARELLERGDARRICVLCPPHLCDQWQRELAEKFHIDAVVVRTSTIARLERAIPRKDISLFRYYPHLIVSIDFAKSDRRRTVFVQDCPDLVIVDEVHAAADPGAKGSREQQQRHELLCALAKNLQRHLLLMSATPHSGIEDSFRSLLGLVRPEFGQLNLQDLAEQERRNLARHLVQRRRGDVVQWLGANTPFPKRVPPYEATYRLTAEYGALFHDVLDFTRETVQTPGLNQARRRVRYWAALSLLRCLMSSPDAAVAAFSAREKTLTPAEEEQDTDEELRQREILDPLREASTLDTVPENAVELGSADLTQTDRAKLRLFRQRAEQIAASGQDPKIEAAEQIISGMLRQGYHPIVYCRFVATAKYVARELEKRLKSRYPTVYAVGVTSETGNDEEREVVIEKLVESEKRILVATDCLSEGINLQEGFDAVLHYDLPWNPNRLEQREGRVDRFGQKRPEVRAVLLFSPDNPIDGIVLDVLIRKAKQIYRDLGITVSVPANSESVAQAVVRALFENWSGNPEQLRLDLGDVDTVKALHLAWDREAEREKASRARFAQHAIKEDELKAELEVTDSVLGDPEAVRSFMVHAAQRLRFTLDDRGRYYLLDPANLPVGIKEKLRWQKPVKVVFDSPPPEEVENAVVLGRNHPLVAFLAERIVGKAFVPKGPEDFQEVARSGAAYTGSVDRRTCLVLLRVRYRLARKNLPDQFAEEVLTTGFRADVSSGDGKLVWLEPNHPQTLALVEAKPIGNISPQEKEQRIERALEELRRASDELRSIANARAKELEASYQRLKQQIGGSRVQATAYAPDILGVYVLLPGGRV